MRLTHLYLLESKCTKCGNAITSRDIDSISLSKGRFCQDCYKAGLKKAKEERDEAENMAERGQSAEVNLMHVSQSVPDRGYDKDRGTPGWIMGEPSPGRSF